MVDVKLFKAQKNTRRFRKNQIVWIQFEYANHLYLRYKYRGKGRYVSGRMEKWNHKGSDWHNVIGSDGLKIISVEEEFAQRHDLEQFPNGD